MDARIEHIFKFMEWDVLTDAQHDLIVSFENHYRLKGRLTKSQMEILEDIFDKANEKA
jgi:hypothetical protein